MMKQTSQMGRDLRETIPRSSHGAFKRADDVDAVRILLSQEAGRIESLLPVRRERMGENPYAFFRAGAALMAADLASTPTTNLRVQSGGDAHLANFGWYGSPERDIVFDMNDFDETLPASFEWDLKRLSTSFVIAGQDNGFSDRDCFRTARVAARSYRDAMHQFAALGFLDVWYAQISAEKILSDLREAGNAKRAKRLEKEASKARRKDSRHVLGKLGEQVDDAYRIRYEPPWVVPFRHLDDQIDSDTSEQAVHDALNSYVGSMPDHLSSLLERYTVTDTALKVVGVGSVGTRCFIVLLEGRDASDPLFLQVKEAGPSVLEPHFGASQYSHHGQRVVEGQRLMQTTSDIFLGWMTSRSNTHYYVRQLKDMKMSADIENYDEGEMKSYARACAWTLAQAHARSTDPAAIAGYVGTGDVFPDAIAQFAVSYAAQNTTDYDAFMSAVDTLM